MVKAIPHDNIEMLSRLNGVDSSNITLPGRTILEVKLLDLKSEYFDLSQDIR